MIVTDKRNELKEMYFSVQYTYSLKSDSYEIMNVTEIIH